MPSKEVLTFRVDTAAPMTLLSRLSPVLRDQDTRGDPPEDLAVRAQGLAGAGRLNAGNHLAGVHNTKAASTMSSPVM
jgi:hypothetical protein